LDPASRSSFNVETAEWACTAPGRLAFRRGVVDRLVSLLGLHGAAFASVPPPPGGATVAVFAASARRVVECWTAARRELAALLQPPTRVVRPEPEQIDWLLPGSAASALCLLRVGCAARGTSALVLARSGPEFSAEEVAFLEALQPVLQLGDERQLEVGETVGALLSPREREIFDYLVRGFRNEDIARAFGTSPATVRNQLVRLYRKTGVCTRSELVGLATSHFLAPRRRLGPEEV